MSIVFTQEGRKLLVRTPYNPDFVTRAKALGGKWDAPHWRFDARIADELRAVCRDVYGMDDSLLLDADLVTVRVTVTGGCYQDKGGIFFAGRSICKATGRDSGATVSAGVSFLEGKPRSGGSVKNWTTAIPAGCVIEVRDFPRAKLDALREDVADFGAVEVLDNATAPDLEALREERGRLTARMAEIDAILAKHAAT